MNLLLSNTVSSGLITTLQVFERICLVIIALLALILIVLVFMQITGGGETNNVITGNKDSYYSQNKSGSREGRITKLIYITLGIIAFLSIVYFILLKVPSWL